MVFFTIVDTDKELFVPDKELFVPDKELFVPDPARMEEQIN